MRPLILSVLIVGLAAGAAVADPRPGLTDPLSVNDHLAAPPSAAGGAAGAFLNPASWAANDRSSLAFWWNDANRPDKHLDNWGFSFGRTLGLAVRHNTIRTGPGTFAGVTDWQVGLARGDRRTQTALAWRWSGGDTDAVPREKALVFGHIVRPYRWLAYGVSGTESMESSARHGVLDLALRPFGRPWLTLFGDYVLRGGERWDDGRLGGGLTVQPVRGLRLGVRLRDDPASDDLLTTFSAGVTLGIVGFSDLSTHEEADGRLYSTYLIETDAPRAPLPITPPPLFVPPVRVVALNLEHKRLTYQRYRYFDDTRVAWLELARTLDAAARDDQVSGVALNLAGFSGRPSLLWELRETLAGLKDRGKTVYIHLDRAGMLLYAVAGVADRITLDPEGMLDLHGLNLSRTYMRGLLDKLGLGFTALQYFDHKTAVESLSRTDMSPADREQRGRVVDVVYEWMRRAATECRDPDEADYDRIVDDEVLVYADEAVALGLADDVARWHDLGDWLAEQAQAVLVAPDASRLRIHADERWGRPPTVAVVYAVGGCDMDTGIKGRDTSAHLRALVGDPDVRAVVLRADSPGGDPLPSDLIAEAISRLRRAGKPVIVSQGDVAASGGYWISMTGTEILTTPLTLTGSIGVISGWVWDETMHEHAGLNADGVSRGAHGDLFRQVRYPLGFAVPHRDMTEREYDMARDRVLTMYDHFVATVSENRGLDPDRVREIGGGRVWMGEDAIERGLCDAVGGLVDAISRARDLAGIDPRDEILIREYPPRPLLEWPKLRLPLPGLALSLPWPGTAAQALAQPDADDEPAGIAFLRALAAAGGAPRLLLSPDWLPEDWRP